MKKRAFNLIALLILVFLTIDLMFIALELFGIHTPFVQRIYDGSRVVLVGSDVLIFILSVPVALLLEVLWEREKWSWFGEGRSLRKNVFVIFLLLFTILFFAIMIGGFHACSGACEALRSCTVTYLPLRVEILYSCRQIIQPPLQ